ncbi:MAG TPA: DUF4013 domain-containing protein [Methanobacteriales archaeon]|nr:DUF4013 domain-containing protein [Methanobacteriaceae archaeon]HIH61330.1 DUF4013 domain-containing protein [Methanobacteriales archaeon]
MDIGEIISDSVKYPISDWKKLLTLGVLLLLSFLLIPVFLAIGYAFRTLKTTIAGFDELPEFDEWGEMFIDGVKVFVVTIAYMIIPLIIIFASIFFTGSYGLTLTNVLLPLQAGGSIMIVGFILAIIFGLLLTIAIAHMAFNDSQLGAAFRISEILEVIADIGWANYIIWYIAIIIVGGIIGFIASLVIGLISGLMGLIAPLVGSAVSYILSALLVQPYLNLFYYRALGLRYAYQ